jgi:serine/threonine protein kinase
MSGSAGDGVELRARQLYERAIGLPPEERDRFLLAECARDEALRSRVELMLSAAAARTRAAGLPQTEEVPSHIASADASSQVYNRSHASEAPHRASHQSMPTLDPATAGGRDRDGRPLSASAEASAALGPRPPSHQIGHYKLLEVIGEGGFGTVWVADQQWPIKRRVALKIIKPGMDSRAVIARFEQERQALAIMDHPHIAKVLDAGTSPDGRPYFVMEYVPGEPITSYCDRNRLTVAQRLELFTTVCEAVQHAHHKGIIHRDIKPSNVLVSVATGSGPVVKVIDFGVAKAVSHNLTDKTLFTEHGQIVGTPEYMSPEQAEMGALDIDTRTDVYALGVLLYELLTGALPFEPHDLRSRGYNEIQRIIREVDPPRPSVRLRSMGKVSADIAAKRQARLEELEGQLRRELEWIPLKAMRKDRGERYATPIALADDIRNHLAGRPLVAGPVSLMYRARKFVQRNKLAVAAAAAIALALIAGTVVSTIGFVRAAHNAEMYRQASELAKAEAARANDEAARLRLVNQFQQDMLFNANPLKGEPRNVTVLELLEKAVLMLDAGAQPDPRIEAALRFTLGQTFRSLTLFRPAELQLRRAVDLDTAAAGSNSPEVARSMSALGQALLDQGKRVDAEGYLRRALTIQRDVLAPDNVHLGDTLMIMGMLEDAKGDLRQAEARYREALAVYERNPRDAAWMADAMSNLATVLSRNQQIAQAVELAQKALDVRRKRWGNRSQDVWYSLHTLGNLQEAQDDLAAAERTRREGLELAGQLYDEKHLNYIRSLGQLARTLWLRGGPALDEAERLETRAVALARASLGPRAFNTAHELDLLACIVRDRGDVTRAVEMFREALAIRREINPPDHQDVGSGLSNLADALTRANHQPPQEAIDLATQALDIRRRAHGANHWRTWVTTGVLGSAYVAAGQYEKAEPLLLDAYKGLENGSNLGSKPKRDAAARLVTLYEKWGKPDEAAKWRARAAVAPATMATTAPATQP